MYRYIMSETIVIYLSKKEKDLIEKFAGSQSLPVSSFCRSVVLKHITIQTSAVNNLFSKAVNGNLKVSDLDAHELSKFKRETEEND